MWDGDDEQGDIKAHDSHKWEQMGSDMTEMTRCTLQRSFRPRSDPTQPPNVSALLHLILPAVLNASKEKCSCATNWKTMDDLAVIDEIQKLQPKRKTGRSGRSCLLHVSHNPNFC